MSDSDVVKFASPYVRGLCEALQYMGHDSAALLRRVGIDEERLTHDWFTLEELDAVFVEAVHTTGDPAFGLHWGERSPMMQFDFGPSAIANAPSLRNAMEAIVRLQFLFANRAQCSFVQQGNRSIISFDLITASTTGLYVMTELTLVSLLRGFKYLGQPRAIRRINVGYDSPPHAREYLRVFGSTLRFGQPRTSIEFASEALDRRRSAFSEPLHRAILDHADEQRQRVLEQVSLASQVEGCIRTALPRLLNIDDAARSFEISARSLRRRLAAENVTYSELVDRVQRARASELLGRGLSVKEISHQTGFRTTSGFHRANKRWTGESPGRSRASSEPSLAAAAERWSSRK